MTDLAALIAKLGDCPKTERWIMEAGTGETWPTTYNLANAALLELAERLAQAETECERLACCYKSVTRWWVGQCGLSHRRLLERQQAETEVKRLQEIERFAIMLMDGDVDESAKGWMLLKDALDDLGEAEAKFQRCLKSENACQNALAQAEADRDEARKIAALDLRVRKESEAERDKLTEMMGRQQRKLAKAEARVAELEADLAHVLGVLQASTKANWVEFPRPKGGRG